MPYRSTLAALVLALATSLAPASARADADTPANVRGTGGPPDTPPVVPAPLKHVGITEHLDGQLPLDTWFRDQSGKPFQLKDAFDGKRPVILTFAYHTCPTLCSMVLNATANSLKNVGWTVGKDFNVVTISIDPKDTLDRTAAKRAGILAQYARPEADKGWFFLLGEDANIHKVADAAGFEYTYDAESLQYGHAATIMIVKPDGRLARYLYGIEFSPTDLKLGLLEAADGKTISTVEKAILYCYRYDAHEGKYVVMANRVMKLGGGATALALGTFLAALWLKERRKMKPGVSGPPLLVPQAGPGAPDVVDEETANDS
jgi:protein SCO1/2